MIKICELVPDQYLTYINYYTQAQELLDLTERLKKDKTIDKEAKITKVVNTFYSSQKKVELCYDCYFTEGYQYDGHAVLNPIGAMVNVQFFVPCSASFQDLKNPDNLHAAFMRDRDKFEEEYERVSNEARKRMHKSGYRPFNHLTDIFILGNGL